MSTYVVQPYAPGNPIFLQGPGLPTIRLRNVPSLAGALFNPQALADSINARMSRSAEYRNRLTSASVVNEGITIDFAASNANSLLRNLGVNSAGRQRFKVTAAISNYRRNNNGYFIDNPSISFELGVVFNTSQVLLSGAFQYDLIARILPEEISLHPFGGNHPWDGSTYGVPSSVNAYLADPISATMLLIARQAGDRIRMFQPVPGRADLNQTDWYVSQSGVRAMLEAAGWPYDPNNPPQPGARVWPDTVVVSDADFDLIHATYTVAALAAAKNGTPGPFPSYPPTIQDERAIAEAIAQSQPPAWASQVADLMGSALSRYLLPNDPVFQVLGSALFQTIGQNVVQAIALGGITRDLGPGFRNGSVQNIKINVLDDFGSEFANAVQGAAIGSFSSFVALELGNALGLKGFGAELFQTGASTVLGQALNNVASGSHIFSGLNTAGLFGSGQPGTSGFSPGLLPGAIGSFLGQKLGSLILAPTSTTGAILSSLGSGLGVIGLTTGAGAFGLGGVAAALGQLFGGLANVGIPFVGSLVGFLLGSLIGRLFGKKKPRIPTASAEIQVDPQSGFWVDGATSVANGGNLAFVKEMAGTAKDTVNSLVSTLVGGRETASLVANGQAQKYGHSGSTVYVDEKVGTTYVRRYSGNDATAAVDTGALAAIRATKIRGGDIILKRAVYSSTQTSVAALLGDVIVASDYSDYLASRAFFNQFMLDNPYSPLTANWFISLARAEEIGITEFRPSDFYGGLLGFAESFGFGRVELGLVGGAFETLTVSLEGGGVRIATNDGSAPFDLLAGSNNVVGADAAKSVYIPNFGSNVGYTDWTGQATAGNDIWIASGLGYGVTMDDLGYQEQWWWNPYDYAWEVTYTEVSGGDDIFVGTAYSDSLYGRTGFDWLDGGEGHDRLDGGDQDDVLIGGGGVDELFGGSGDDYLAGGAGNDYVQSWIGGPAPGGLYGGAGNDTLVGNDGVDAFFGEDGDDTFIVDQDGGGTWDYYSGGAGSDTASFERFSAGVSFDMRTGTGSGYTTLSYGDGFVSIENLTGSRHSDYLVGDEQSNVLRGLDGNDIVYGLDGDDIIEGGAGADTLNGGGGTNTLSYELSRGGVSVDLGSGIAKGADAIGDTFVSMHNLRGSRFSDELTGDAGNNVLDGLRGDDRFYWSGGYDTINGGEGFDSFDASRATGSLTVYSGSYAYVNGVYSYLSSIEGYVGTQWGDSISGGTADELFDGGAGNDYLAGGSGSDTYAFGYGDGYDTVDETNDGHNAIVFEGGINWRNVLISGVGGSGTLYVYLGAAWEYIAVTNNFSYGSDGNHNHKIKTIDLGGLSSVDIGHVDWMPSGHETDAATYTYGAQSKADLIFTYGGDDVVYAAGGYSAWENRDNVVYAGDGSDVIYSSAGDDTYIFERGNGADFLNDTGGADTIVMGPSVAADDVIYEVVVTSSDAYGGQKSDLYVGIRDPNNPSLGASQVADRIRIQDGGTILYDLNYGTYTHNTIEHLRVGGQEIDLTKAGINFTTSYYISYGGGGGGGGGGPIPPIAIDLDGDGIELRSVEGSRISTIDADGNLWRLGWLGPDDGFLALDRDGNGAIDRLGEIQFINDLEGAKSDLEGLAAYDSNGDGKLDASDARWADFKVWSDKNQDGIGVGKELISLEQAGIVSISLKGQATGFTPTDGIDNTVLATTSIAWADPKRTGLGYDVALAAYQVRSDSGGKEQAERAKGKDKADSIDARLFGIQTMTKTEIEAHKAKKGAVAGAGEGLLGRVETFLPNAQRDGLGLLKTTNARTVHDKNVKDAKDGDKDAKKDKFAESDWSREASKKVEKGKQDLKKSGLLAGSDLNAGAEPSIRDAGRSGLLPISDLSDGAMPMLAQLDAGFSPSDAVEFSRRAPVGMAAAETGGPDIQEAIAYFENLRHVAADKDNARLEREAAENNKPLTAVRPPSAEEMAERARNDKFRLLSPIDGEAGADTAVISRDTSSASAERGNARSNEDIDGESADVPSHDAHGRARVPAPIGERSGDPIAPAQPANDAAQPESGYDVRIARANARLIQALATFGDNPAMMSNYRGLVAPEIDQHTGWLTVGRLASVHNLAHIA